MRVLLWSTCGAVLLGLCGTPLLRADEPSLANPPDKKAENVKPAAKSEPQSGITNAMMAAQLAFEGEKRKSPVLLVAAAELLGGVQESDRKTTDVKGAGASTAKGDKEAPKLTAAELLGKARKLAEGDASMTAVVDKAFEESGKRGLSFNQGASKPDVTIAGRVYKIIDAGVIAPGQRLTLTNVQFDGGKFAAVAAVGDGDGDLDMGVFDGNNGGVIGLDRQRSSACVVTWTPIVNGPFTVILENVGGKTERYVVLANW